MTLPYVQPSTSASVIIAIAEQGLGCNMGRLCTDCDRQFLAKDVGSCGTFTRLFRELYLQEHRSTGSNRESSRASLNPPDRATDANGAIPASRCAPLATLLGRSCMPYALTGAAAREDLRSSCSASPVQISYVEMKMKP